MRAALEAYLTTLNGGASHHDAVVAAAYAVRSEPWEVVQSAGLLARCRPAIAPVTTGLTPSLRRVPMGSRAAVVSVKAGQSYPVVADKRRYGRGVHDPPVDLARRVVQIQLLLDGTPVCSGSGSIVSSDGLVLTNSHVIAQSAVCPHDTIGVAVVDRAEDALSAVYTYFDPDHGRSSPGVFSILTQLQLCKRWGLRYLYLGLYVEDCKAMAYKSSYLPHERRVGNAWRRFD